MLDPSDIAAVHEDNDENYDAGDEGPVIVDFEAAKELFLDACRAAAKVGF